MRALSNEKNQQCITAFFISLFFSFSVSLSLASVLCQHSFALHESVCAYVCLRVHFSLTRTQCDLHSFSVYFHWLFFFWLVDFIFGEFLCTQHFATSHFRMQFSPSMLCDSISWFLTMWQQNVDFFRKKVVVYLQNAKLKCGKFMRTHTHNNAKLKCQSTRFWNAFCIFKITILKWNYTCKYLRYRRTIQSCKWNVFSIFFTILLKSSS